MKLQHTTHHIKVLVCKPRNAYAGGFAKLIDQDLLAAMWSIEFEFTHKGFVLETDITCK